jgi:hypothetical protein
MEDEPEQEAEDGRENSERPKRRAGVTAQQRQAEKDRKRNKGASMEADAIDEMVKRSIEKHGP